MTGAASLAIRNYRPGDEGPCLALVLAGVQRLRQQGMASAALYVDGANDRARHLCEAAGFGAVRTEMGYREVL